MAELTYKHFKRARAKLSRSAGREFPALRGEIGRATIGARLKTLDINVGDAYKMSGEMVERDREPLIRQDLIHTPNQLRVLQAAIMAGIAVGVQAERMRK